MDVRGPQLDIPSGELVDGGAPAQPLKLRKWLAFAGGAVRRRKGLAASVFFLGVAACGVYLNFRTPTYRVETKILAQKQQSLPSSVRPIDDPPTRSASDLIHQRENLIAIIKQTNLFSDTGPITASPARWYSRLPLLRRFSSVATTEDRLNNLVKGLDRALVVVAGEDTVTIRIDWGDPEAAYRILEAALQNFLEARHVKEITVIDEVISLLQARASTLREELEKVLQEQRGPAEPATAAGPPVRRAPSEETVRLKSMLEAKQRTIRDMEDFRQKRLSDLQAQLDEKRGIYSDAYPSVVSLRQDIEAISRESPQITEMREEVAKLRAQYAARAGRELPETPTASALVPRTSRRGAEGVPEEAEPVRDARFRYQQMLERISAAQVELDSARAAFKHRYRVIWPAQVPRWPKGPSGLTLLTVGTLFSFLLAVLASMVVDLKAARIVERWQVERMLDLAVLAGLKRK